MQEGEEVGDRWQRGLEAPIEGDQPLPDLMQLRAGKGEVGKVEFEQRYLIAGTHAGRNRVYRSG